MGHTSGVLNLSVIIIDDNLEHLKLMSATLEMAFESDSVELTTLQYDNPANALAELTDVPNQVILIDYQFAGSTGLDWLTDFIKADVGPVILVTSSGDETIAAKAFRHGAADYIVKSNAFKNPEVIHRSIKEALRKSGLEQINHDLSNRLKLANRELNSKNRKLTELTDTAHRFVEDVAHEFRTPLTVIKEFASIIADGLGGEVTPKQAEYLNHITGSAGDLAGLIDDFLNSSRLRSNSICVNRKEYTISTIFDAVWPMLQSRAASKSIKLERDVDEGLPSIYADADKMQRSLINLVVNAIKFSESDGTVRISAYQNDECSVRIAVHDEGPGLPESALAELFERFNQGGKDERRLANGFGLGLNIVKELVAINLGSVDIQSEVGVGSTFSFTVPISDNRSVVRGLVEQAKKRAGNPKIVVLSANRARDDQPIEELAEYLNSMSYPMDLILHSDDRSDVLLIGITEEGDSFRKRILLNDVEHRQGQEKPFSDLRVNLNGRWSTQQAETRILELIDSTTRKDLSHA